MTYLHCFRLSSSREFVKRNILRLIKLLRKISIQIPPICVIPTRRSGQRRKPTEKSAAFRGASVAVRIHGGHDEDLRLVQESGDAFVVAVVLQEVLGQIQQHLSAQRLVAVHVPDVLKHGLQGRSVLDIAADFDHRQLATLHGLTHGGHLGQVRKSPFQILQFGNQCAVILVPRYKASEMNGDNRIACDDNCSGTRDH